MNTKKILKLKEPHLLDKTYSGSSGVIFDTIGQDGKDYPFVAFVLNGHVMREVPGNYKIIGSKVYLGIF